MTPPHLFSIFHPFSSPIINPNLNFTHTFPLPLRPQTLHFISNSSSSPPPPPSPPPPDPIPEKRSIVVATGELVVATGELFLGMPVRLIKHSSDQTSNFVSMFDNRSGNVYMYV
uniref:Uncharacterized protein n=1 Tax=Cucumis sativus TaxID=3659 RepID=A0A0A0L1C8_CUCSA